MAISNISGVKKKNINNFQVCLQERTEASGATRRNEGKIIASLPGSAGAAQQVRIAESSQEQSSSPPPAHRRMRAPEMRARSCEADLDAGSSSGRSRSSFNPRTASETRLRRDTFGSVFTACTLKKKNSKNTTKHEGLLLFNLDFY